MMEQQEQATETFEDEVIRSVVRQIRSALKIPTDILESRWRQHLAAESEERHDVPGTSSGSSAAHDRGPPGGPPLLPRKKEQLQPWEMFSAKARALQSRRPAESEKDAKEGARNDPTTGRVAHKQGSAAQASKPATSSGAANKRKRSDSSSSEDELLEDDDLEEVVGAATNKSVKEPPQLDGQTEGSRENFSPGDNYQADLAVSAAAFFDGEDDLAVPAIVGAGSALGSTNGIDRLDEMPAALLPFGSNASSRDHLGKGGLLAPGPPQSLQKPENFVVGRGSLERRDKTKWHVRLETGFISLQNGQRELLFKEGEAKLHF
ncbi:unnamed protein product [Amoebophrya sp. A120]|nr:unnamed protein product [Amoebophrya sp. A120]|eukprot:GSA120T00001862001.1